MKRTTLILLVAGALAMPFFLGTGFAQGWGGMHGRGVTNTPHMGSRMMGPGFMMQGTWNNHIRSVPPAYRLTEDQQESVKNIRSFFPWI